MLPGGPTVLAASRLLARITQLSQPLSSASSHHILLNSALRPSSSLLDVPSAHSGPQFTEAALDLTLGGGGGLEQEAQVPLGGGGGRKKTQQENAAADDDDGG